MCYPTEQEIVFAPTMDCQFDKNGVFDIPAIINARLAAPLRL
jgi:hypothetical protein